MKINETFLNAKAKAYPHSKFFTYLYFVTLIGGIIFLTSYLILGGGEATINPYIHQIVFSFSLMGFWFVLGIFSLEIEKPIIRPIPHVFIGFVFFILTITYELPYGIQTDHYAATIHQKNTLVGKIYD